MFEAFVVQLRRLVRW